MEMRLRLPELLAEHDVTAYELARRSEGRILPSTLYRLVRSRGKVKFIDSDLLEALCDLLKVEPGALLEREKPKARRK